MERLLAPCTNKIVCISEAERASALREHIAADDKLVLIPNGIDIDAVRSAEPLSRQELGIAEDAFVVGMVGRVSPQKAPDVFIRAARLIHEQISNSAFIIVGDGEERKEVEAYAKKQGLHLIVTGWTDEPYRYLKVFDTALLLSRWEGFGLAVVEYMAAEKNVVATRTDAIPTLVNDGVDGLLVDVDNPKDAADKVLWLYNHPAEAATMRKEALRKVKEQYTLERVINQHEGMIVNLCKRGVIQRWNNNISILKSSVAVLYKKERRVAA